MKTTNATLNRTMTEKDRYDIYWALSEMLNNFAATLDNSRRKSALGIAQVVMLAELAVNQALDKVEIKP